MTEKYTVFLRKATQCKSEARLTMKPGKSPLPIHRHSGTICAVHSVCLPFQDLKLGSFDRVSSCSHQNCAYPRRLAGDSFVTRLFAVLKTGNSNRHKGHRIGTPTSVQGRNSAAPPSPHQAHRGQLSALGAACDRGIAARRKSVGFSTLAPASCAASRLLLASTASSHLLH